MASKESVPTVLTKFTKRRHACIPHPIPFLVVAVANSNQDMNQRNGAEGRGDGKNLRWVDEHDIVN